MQTSRIPEFYKLSVADRVRLVREKGLLSKDDYLALASGEHTLKIITADRMIENVIGVFGLPLGLAAELPGQRPRLRRADGGRGAVGRRRARAHAAKLVRAAGGFSRGDRRRS